ncbi:mycothiol transferase [Kitasatospora sp. NPDC001664]
MGDPVDGLRGRREEDHRAVPLRSVRTDTIEDHARHDGHADLLREAIDGEVGE